MARSTSVQAPFAIVSEVKLLETRSKHHLLIMFILRGDNSDRWQPINIMVQHIHETHPICHGTLKQENEVSKSTNLRKRTE